MNIIPEPNVLAVQAVGFIVLLLVFRKFLFKPIMGILEARQKEIEGQYSEAEAQRANAEELKAQYEQHLAKIDEEMRAKITEAVKEGQTLREEILSDSRDQADNILTKAQAEIEREKDKAIFELKVKVADLAVGAANKLIDENLDAEKHRELIGKYIDGLESVSK